MDLRPANVRGCRKMEFDMCTVNSYPIAIYWIRV